MNHVRHTALSAALVLALSSFAAMGQSSAPQLALPDMTTPSASAPPPAASASFGPRLRSAAETGNRAVPPGDLHPERPVAPQISIPFGKKAPPPTPREERLVQRGNAAATGGVDDAAARCEAQVEENARNACRAKLANEAKGKLPN